MAKRENLEGHLLPGLDPSGIPKSLAGTVFPFNYNRISELKKIIKENPDLAAVKMEVVRSVEPEEGFLQEVRKLCTKIILY